MSQTQWTSPFGLAKQSSNLDDVNFTQFLNQSNANPSNNNMANTQLEVLPSMNGLGNYGAYTLPDGTSVGLNETAFNAMKGTDHGGTLTGGSSGITLSDIGTGVDILGGLAGAYFAKKNYDLQKDQQDYLKSRDAMADAKTAKFATNVGGGATV